MSPLKKSLRASEQQRPDVARARRRWMREQSMFDPARLVFMVLAEVMVEFREMAKEQAEAARAGDKEAQQKRVYYQGTLETDKANYWSPAFASRAPGNAGYQEETLSLPGPAVHYSPK